MSRGGGLEIIHVGIHRKPPGFGTRSIEYLPDLLPLQQHTDVMDARLVTLRRSRRTPQTTRSEQVDVKKERVATVLVHGPTVVTLALSCRLYLAGPKTD